MRVAAIKALFLLTSTYLATIPKDLYQTHIKTAYIFAVNKKVTKTSFEEKCNEFLVIRYRILNVMVPLQLLVTAI
jgi:hypothetical protein